MRALTQKEMEILIVLDTARAEHPETEGWTRLAQGEYADRRRLQDLDLIEARGATANREYHILDAGIHAMAMGFVDGDRTSPTAQADGVQPRPLPLVDPATYQHQADCADCIYRRALELVATEWPEINELVTALRKIKSRKA